MSDITPEVRESARTIGETMIAMRKGTATVEDFRAANRASRERHGEDIHNIVKGLAIAGATGGKA
jgi:hypothetical protein